MNIPSFLVNTIKIMDFPWRTVSLQERVPFFQEMRVVFGNVAESCMSCLVYRHAFFDTFSVDAESMGLCNQDISIR